ncbi:MAG: hypothetical protein HRT99_02385 [Mycoplasmatales bacterium]|nr:hypothetical protein [Mycoplasmatales bacterium]
MKTKNEIIKWAKLIDEKYADYETDYGAVYKNNKWILNLWQPLAKEVFLIIFDKNDQDKIIEKIKGIFTSPNWKWEIDFDYDGYFYQYEIIQKDNSKTIVLDPYSKSMAAFNWEGKENKIGKGAFIKYNNVINPFKINLNKKHPIIYEANVRDLTSLIENLKNPGSFNALKEVNFGSYIRKLGFNTIQLLPINSCYAIDETNQQILQKGQGNKWITNYNWGYDPHNYFSLNGWYSTNPNDPYNRMNEFRELVSHFHKNSINVVIDVVFNHLMHNWIFNDIFPDYYFRDGSDRESSQNPVKEAPFASERKMARKIIIDALIWMVKKYDVDGFRFDLSCFIDRETFIIIHKELNKIKPGIILHGEAWGWTDLEPDMQMIKGRQDNQIEFAYFNDSTRNAIKGQDDINGYFGGLINNEKFDENFSIYLASIIGNIKQFKNAPKEISIDDYDRFTKNPNVNLQYIVCHDGHTLWDKINLSINGDLTFKIQKYRQALIMLLVSQGKILLLSGTEMLYTKPNDDSGQDGDRFYESENIIDLFNLGSRFNENTYKTTDWSAGLRWEQLQNPFIKKNIFNFLQKILNFRHSSSHFNLNNSKEINESIKFNVTDKENGIIDFSININNQIIRVIHNLKSKKYFYTSGGEIIFHSDIKKPNLNTLKGFSSIIISEINS